MVLRPSTSRAAACLASSSLVGSCFVGSCCSGAIGRAPFGALLEAVVGRAYAGGSGPALLAGRGRRLLDVEPHDVVGELERAGERLQQRMALPDEVALEDVEQLTADLGEDAPLGGAAVHRLAVLHGHAPSSEGISSR